MLQNMEFIYAMGREDLQYALWGFLSLATRRFPGYQPTYNIYDNMKLRFIIFYCGLLYYDILYHIILFFM